MNYKLLSPVDSSLTVVEQIFKSRGIEPNQIQHFLYPTISDLYAPELLDNMKQGAQMLISHIAQRHRIMIQVDSDADGMTSSAVLINYLNILFPNFVQTMVYYRIHEGKEHGILFEAVPADVKLVIAPDSSSSDYDVHKKLHDMGIDVLVLDHHDADKVSEYACVINNQLCNYPNKSLSGVGVVYKFCEYLDSLLGNHYADTFLDLVACGIIADVMELKNLETRYIITEGLKNIHNGFLKGMVERQAFKLGNQVTPFGVAFYIAPYINATIRSGTQDEKLLLFEAMLDFKGNESIPSTKRGCKGQYELRVEQACRSCTNIKNRQTKARDAGLEIIERIIEKEDLLKNKILAIRIPEAESQKINKNITGLIANILMDKYQKPTLILRPCRNPETNVLSWEGSGRGLSDSDFDNFKEFLTNLEEVEYGQGHANAFGVGILDEHFDEFIKVSNEILANFDFQPCYKVDFIFSAQDIAAKDILDIAELNSIWGKGISQPLIAIENLAVTNDNLKLLSPDKSPTLRIDLPNDMSLIKFKVSTEEFETLHSERGCVKINVVGKCDINNWNGVIKPQIQIEDYEIVGRTQFYF